MTRNLGLPSDLPLSVLGWKAGSGARPRRGGRQGAFHQELDSALERGDIDLAVHSAKDLPTFLPQGLEISGYLPREDVRDAWISAKADDPRALPPGSVVGTASLRRSAMLLRLRPDLAISLLARQCRDAPCQARARRDRPTILAIAGLKRLGLADRRRASSPPPISSRPSVRRDRHHRAPGRCRRSQRRCAPSSFRHGRGLACERALLQVLDGSVRRRSAVTPGSPAMRCICVPLSCVRTVRNLLRPRSAAARRCHQPRRKGGARTPWRGRRPAFWRVETCWSSSPDRPSRPWRHW